MGNGMATIVFQIYTQWTSFKRQFSEITVGNTKLSAAVSKCLVNKTYWLSGRPDFKYLPVKQKA